MSSTEQYKSLMKTISEVCKKHQREEFIPFLENFLNYPTEESEISTETIVDFTIKLNSFRHILLALADEGRAIIRPDISMLVLMATIEGENVMEWKVFKTVEFSKEFFECLRTSLSEFKEKEGPLQELFNNISEN